MGPLAGAKLPQYCMPVIPSRVLMSGAEEFPIRPPDTARTKKTTMGVATVKKLFILELFFVFFSVYVVMGCWC